MTKLLAEKTALITGGGVGIGRGIAIMMAQQGARIAVTYNSHEPDTEFASLIKEASGHDLLALKVDGTNESEVKEAVNTVGEQFKVLDILVNNIGGLIKRAYLPEIELSLWNTIMDVNVTSTFLFTREAHRILKKEGGRIINVASLAAESGGHPGALGYATSKGAIVSFTRSLAKELAPEGITVNCVAPGFIEATPFHDTFTTADSKAQTITTIPLGRAGNPTDVAGVIVWLASELSSYVTGTVTDINGGQQFN